MHLKKHLSFGSLRHALSKKFREIPDDRQSSKTNYLMHDTMMSGFACMYFQDPSLLQFQERLQQKNQRNNLCTLFDVENIPKESQMRNVIDQVNPKDYEGIFKEFYQRLQRGKHLESFKFIDDLYLCSMDGTQYFSSPSIYCKHCLTTQHRNGDLTYSHKVLQAAIMHPNMKQVIPMMPEEIRNTDGNKKQDCEINAAKRLLSKIRSDHSKLRLVMVGDGLYSKQPLIENTLENGMHYIYVAKPKDHTYLIEWLAAYDELETVRFTDEKGKTHLYQWKNDVPLNGGEKSIHVNYFSYKILGPGSGGLPKVNFQNSWVTDLEVTEENVRLLVKGGRCRWKIENECFNTLKNQGYQLEHNYGHGSEFLCFNFYLLTLLAFFFHQIFELTDKIFQQWRVNIHSKLRLWENLRGYMRMFVFETWEDMLEVLLHPNDFDFSFCHVSQKTEKT